jgi:predicted metal-dependent HD superfamily phosphohydrolase
VLIDADLAVLGSEPAAYQAYVTGVRAEYASVDDAAWRRGRSEVVRDLLDREPLYATEPARRRWEARARANLTAELATLGQRFGD